MSSATNLEARLLTAIAESQSLDEQARLMQRLEDHRASVRQQRAAERELDLAAKITEPAFTAVRTFERNTHETDWLASTAAGTVADEREAVRTARAEALMWKPTVEAIRHVDAGEYAEQARGKARQVASSFGPHREAAIAAFLKAAGAEEPSDADLEAAVDAVKFVEGRRKQARVEWHLECDACGANTEDSVYDEEMEAANVNDTCPVCGKGTLVEYSVDLSHLPRGGRRKRASGEIGERRTLTLPWSEVNMHMQLAGETVDAELVGPHAVQLYEQGTDNPISFPITTGEAGWGMVGSDHTLTDFDEDGYAHPKASARRTAAPQARDLKSGTTVEIDGKEKTIEDVSYSPGGGGRATITFSDGSTKKVPSSRRLKVVERNSGGGGDQSRDEDGKFARRRTAAEGDTCAVCGDSIARDQSNEDPSTWHHDNGEKHDHEAKPADSSKESRLRRRAAHEVGDVYIDPETGHEWEVLPNGDHHCNTCGSSYCDEENDPEAEYVDSSKESSRRTAFKNTTDVVVPAEFHPMLDSLHDEGYNSFWEGEDDYPTQEEYWDAYDAGEDIAHDYWAYSKPGWRFRAMGSHTAHEPTAEDLIRVIRTLEPCDCAECQARLGSRRKQATSPDYAFLITKDHIDTGAEGTNGPYGVDEAQVERLRNGGGTAFQMFDDDGNLYYEGRFFEDAHGEQDPLFDFGMPFAGCTRMTIKNRQPYISKRLSQRLAYDDAFPAGHQMGVTDHNGDPIVIGERYRVTGTSIEGIAAGLDTRHTNQSMVGSDAGVVLVDEAGTPVFTSRGRQGGQFNLLRVSSRRNAKRSKPMNRRSQQARLRHLMAADVEQRPDMPSDDLVPGSMPSDNPDGPSGEGEQSGHAQSGEGTSPHVDPLNDNRGNRPAFPEQFDGGAEQTATGRRRSRPRPTRARGAGRTRADQRKVAVDNPEAWQPHKFYVVDAESYTTQAGPFDSGEQAAGYAGANDIVIYHFEAGYTQDKSSEHPLQSGGSRRTASKTCDLCSKPATHVIGTPFGPQYTCMGHGEDALPSEMRPRPIEARRKQAIDDDLKWLLGDDVNIEDELDLMSGGPGSTSVEVPGPPRPCDICSSATAKYDGKTKMGPWANMCEGCFSQYGVGLGTGKGQELIYTSRRRATMRRTASRPIHEIAADIEAEWDSVNYAARPYLDAMHQLDSINDRFFMDDAKSIILYFLSNARSFRGERAKELKAELKALG